VAGEPALLMRRLYTALWWIALPALPLRLWWRGRREQGYREHVRERFGRYDVARPDGELVWIHAVSLGETRAAAPLVARVLRERPGASVLLTHMTATGRASGATLADPRVIQAWLPYDVPFAVRRFLDHFRPQAGLLMETELWPNLLAEARARGIPVLLVNARLSERSARGYARAPGLARELFGNLAGVAAQGERDAHRLRALGADDVTVIGNLKFDVSVPDEARTQGRALRARLSEARPVWLAASTRDGEEALIVDALLAARDALPPGTVTAIVPRHPQRFAAVAQLLRDRGVRFAQRTDAEPLPRDVDVFLGNSVGELLTYYSAADVAFVGGSLLPLGGQNLIEPLAVGTPTLVGPHTFNFADATEYAIAAGAARRVADAQALIAAVGGLLRDPAARDAMRASAQQFFAAHRGATDRLWAWLAPRIPRH
jgi:3-deoxy-D-manno-octulosonic-acid transferase